MIDLSGQSTGRAEFVPVLADDFERGEGPLDIVNDLVAMAKGLEAERDRAAQTNTTCCLVVTRPDHVASLPLEMVLDEIGKRFANSLRGYDAVYRHGPDKYIVTLPRISREDASLVMARLRRLVSSESIPVLGGEKIPVTASFGGAMMEQDSQIQETIDRAEEALLTAAAAGVNRVCMWSENLRVDD
ncbi:MAG: diguanylate cyclase [Alphaproteobacteria bacterium]